MSDFDLATRLTAIAEAAGGSITPPIVQTSLFAFDSFAAFEARMDGSSDAPMYTRVQNPTVAAFEEMMAVAEGGEAAVGFASGMGAISASLMAFLRPGDRVACVNHVYPDSYRFMERILRPFGIETTYHSLSDFENDPDLLKGIKVAFLEGPTSVVFEPLDLAKVAAHAKRHGTITMIDNSWASPVFQNPLALGIDIVIHSASKYISGHSDTVAGVVIASKAHIAKLRDLSLPLFGAKLAPFEAWLLIRGLRTLVPRMRQHQETANLFVERFSKLACVRKINSPGRDCPGLKGRSGLMSVEFDASVDIAKLADALKLFRLGVSWGGFESLILPAKVGLAQAGEFNSMRKFGVPETLVRLSLGLEAAEDLWADMEAAIRSSQK
jgi:cystathionine beta-lyase/cystathionine gamma-synthase